MKATFLPVKNISSTVHAASLEYGKAVIYGNETVLLRLDKDSYLRVDKMGNLSPLNLNEVRIYGYGEPVLPGSAITIFTN